MNTTISIDSGSLQSAGVISGLGSLTKTGPSPMILIGSSVYGGATVVNQGMLNIFNARARDRRGPGERPGDPVLRRDQLYFRESDHARFNGAGCIDECIRDLHLDGPDYT